MRFGSRARVADRRDIGCRSKTGADRTTSRAGSGGTAVSFGATVAPFRVAANNSQGRSAAAASTASFGGAAATR